MYDLVFKNYIKSVFLFIISVGATSCASLLGFPAVEVPMPVFILGILAGFLVYAFIFYPKASVGQVLQVAISGITINAVNLVITSYICYFFELSKIDLNSDFMLLIDPITLAISFVFSVLVLSLLVKIEKVEETPAIEVSEPQNKVEEVIPFNFSQEPPAVLPVTLPAETALPAIPTESQPKTLYEEIYHDSLKPEAENKPVQEVYFDALEEIDIKTEETPKEPKEEKKADYIPIDIRLVDNVQSKQTESKGKIGAIGKLLVNNRDIENVIDSNSALSESFLSGKTNIVSTISGEKIYEKFNEIKNKFALIREMALIDKGGFILANDFADKQRVQIAGALIAGVYHTLQNYLEQLSLGIPIRIFFETENSKSFILKTKNELFFSIWDIDFKLVDYGHLAEILEAENFTEIDIMPYADLIKIEKFAVTDNQGRLINSLDDTEDSHRFAAVLSAMFENIKVFLMNIQLVRLNKIAIFTPDKVITIIKVQDKIAGFQTSIVDLPTISAELLNLEEI